MDRRSPGTSLSLVRAGLGAAFLVAGPAPAAEVPCNELNQIRIDRVHVDEVERRGQGSFAAPDGQQLDELPSFCRFRDSV